MYRVAIKLLKCFGPNRPGTVLTQVDKRVADMLIKQGRAEYYAEVEEMVEAIATPKPKRKRRKKTKEAEPETETGET